MTKDSLIGKALDYQASGDLAQAAEHFMRAFALDGSDWRLPWEAGITYTYHLKNAAAGIPCFEQAIPLLAPGVQRADGYYHLGFSYVALGNDAAAQERFHSAFAECPVHLLSGLELSKLYVRAGQFQAASDLLRKTLDTNSVLEVTPAMLPAGLQGGPHVRLIAIMELARLNYFGLNDAKEGMYWAGLLAKAKDAQRLRKLSEELASANKAEHSDAVLALS